MSNKLRLISTTNQIEDKICWVKQVIAGTNEEIDKYNKTAPVEKQLNKRAFEEDKTTIGMIRRLLRKGFASATR
jgi:hypothetical protein